MTNTSIDLMKHQLATVAEGPVDMTTPLGQELLQALVDAWASFAGHDQGGMKPGKLPGRLEKVRWTPPATLDFEIERHGGTVNGSSRAQLQAWTLDLGHATAAIKRTGHRQLYPMASPLNVAPIAMALATKIRNGEADERLTWKTSDQVRINIGKAVGGDYAQTTAGRSRRLIKALREELEPSGWAHELAGNFHYFRKL